VLGISVGLTTVRAVVAHHGRIAWVGSAPYASTEDLADALARLAAEAGRPVRRTRVVLERALIQLRTLAPAPPIKGRDVARYVALEAPRLFRKNGVPLVTDGALLRLDKKTRALWTGAAPEPVVRAVLEGCAQAGLMIEALGPAADVLPGALASFEQGPVAVAGGEIIEICEGGVVRSRLARGAEIDKRGPWTPVLANLGEQAGDFAAAFGAALALPRLSLLPDDLRAAQARASHRRAARLAVAAAVLWLGALSLYVGRLVSTLGSAERFLAASTTAVDSALVLRRELAEAHAALALLRAIEARRSRHLELLAQLTGALGDSAYVVALRVGSDGTVRVAGYAPVAARALAAFERVLREPRFEGPVTRETGDGGRELDRFAIVGRWEPRP
jgi:hypothetical protein